MGWLLWRAGAIFAAVWGVTIILFPFYKGLPLGLLPVAAGAMMGAAAAAMRARLTAVLMAGGDTAFIAVLTASGLALRVAAAAYFPLEPANDHEMFYRLARSVASGQGYAVNGTATAFFPPGMPLVVALFLRVFGETVVAAKAVGVLSGTALIPATYVFARRVSGRAAARWAALIVATLPTLVVYSATIGYEPLLAMLVLAWATVTAGAARSGSTWVRAIAIGLLAGAATLVKPIGLLLPALSFICCGAAGSWSRALRVLAIATGAMLVVVLPWTLRNWNVLGHPVVVSTNGGFTLYSANHEGSTGLATRMTPLPGEVDEVSRDRIRGRAARDWIRDNPAGFVALMAPKAVYGWGTTSSIMSFVSYDRLPPRQEDFWKALLNVGWGAFFVWCAAAAWTSRIWSAPQLAPALVFVLYLFAVHLVYEALSRHHVTALPVLAVTAAAWLSSGTRPESDRSQV